MAALDTLLPIVSDLTSALSASDRHERLLAAVRRLIPGDAAALLRWEGDHLTAVAIHGLRADVLGRRFDPRSQPRLAAIIASDKAVQFAPDSPLPDPFDGLVLGDATALARVHACLGCPLRVDGALVGVLTVDGLDPEAFRDLSPGLLDVVGALAGAAVHTGDLVAALERAASRQGLIAKELMRDARERQGGDLLGTSAAMVHVRREIALVAPSHLPVLVVGETGVGKELVVRAIHAGSGRRDEPLVYVNCAALPETLAEAELFGHVRGAFTGATADRPGKLDVAHGGTLFLDEIGELSLGLQPKLLRALQQGEIQRVGSDRPVRVDVRLLAATNRDLGEAVRAGTFRADLYHRLAVYPVQVPPLRTRREDVAVLCGHFCDLLRVRLGTGPVRVHPDVLAALTAYDWPGNVRELENVLSRLVLRAAARVPAGSMVLVDGAGLEDEWLPGLHVRREEGDAVAGARAMPGGAAPAVPSGPPLPYREAVKRFERSLLEGELARQGGNWSAAARALGLDRGNIHHLARRLGLRDTEASSEAARAAGKTSAASKSRGKQGLARRR